MYGCSKCRGNGCVRCRPELITALLPVVWATIASAYAVISHAQGVQSTVESFIELNLAADDANGLDSVIWQDGTDNRSRGRLNKRYLTREDRGLPPDGIQRPRKKLKGDRDVASIRRSPFGNTTLTTLTRLSLPEFDALLNKRSTKLNKAPDAHVSTPGTQHTLSTLIELPQNLPRRGKRKFTDTEVYARKQKRRGKPRLSPENQLLLFLSVMVSPKTWAQLALDFGISATSASNIYYHVMYHLNDVLYDGPDRTVGWPTSQERKEMAKTLVGLGGCIGYIDGTRVRHKKPVVGQGVQYSGKVKYHCRNNQVIVDIWGRFIDVEPPMNGSAHDVKLWRYSTVRVQRDEHFDDGQFLLGDPGYIMDDINIKVPASADECKGNLTKQHVADVHRRHRFLVEYSIGSAKRNFPLAGCPGGSAFLKSAHYHGVAWAVACGLQNFMWDSSGRYLRGENYKKGQWEWWEYDYILKKYNKQEMCHPDKLFPGEGVTSVINEESAEGRVFGREDL